PNVFNLTYTLPGTTVTLPLVNTGGMNYPVTGSPTVQTHAFPFIFPGAYSQPDPLASQNPNLGWIHVPDPNKNATLLTSNHAPLDVGDSLSPPLSPQTWWGFPTWRETMSPFWLDPVWQPQFQGSSPNWQTLGLQPIPTSQAISATSASLLPPPV